MLTLTLAEVADATGGRLDDADPAAAVTAPAAIDSRAVTPGGLFVAVRGERVDGHDYAGAAVDAGAVAVLAARPVGVPAVLVDDPTAALGRLAGAVRGRLTGCTVVGLTGSQGKTGTKDLLAAVLARLGPVVAPVGSYNNELGVPLTVLTADASTRHLVVEMGARGGGHIAYLATMTRPDVGLVLNVGVAHVGEFGSREAIARAKGELVEALQSDGVAVLNADDPLVAAMASRTSARVLTFGTHDDADVRLRDLHLDDGARPRFVLETAAGSADVALRTLGAHQATNAVAAAAVGLARGLPLPDVAAALSAAEPASRWRMEPARRADGLLVVNDAYNANPDSVAAALRTLAVLGRSHSGRTVAVLGEMCELGDTSRVEHETVGRLAAELGTGALLAVGTAGAAVLHGARSVEGWPGDAVSVADADAAVGWLTDHVEPADVVLVKASRAVGLEGVAAALLTVPGPGTRDTASGTEPERAEGPA